jgi:exopolyphosphatase/guanosine-5'-triphosphate,3'-diphosphate pyrophosphatase
MRRSDLGTNNCRLLVARATRDSFAWSTRSRASSGSARASPAPGLLSEAAILRAVDALRVCRAKMRNRGVTRSRLIATEACRSAGNGQEFLETHPQRGRHRA